MALQATNPRHPSARLDDGLLADSQLPVDERARHDGAEAADREDAVDRQARPADVAHGWQRVQQRVERLRQVV